MTSPQAIPEPTASGAATVPLRFEVTVIPVGDVDRAKAFYQGLGWRLDADFPVSESYRVVQFTPPGSPASIQFGTGMTDLAPGTLTDLYLIVDDLDAARDELIAPGRRRQRGLARARRARDGRGTRAGPRPGQQRRTGSFASFNDPDGNRWLLQEIKQRLPGRV